MALSDECSEIPVEPAAVMIAMRFAPFWNCSFSWTLILFIGTPFGARET